MQSPNPDKPPMAKQVSWLQITRIFFELFGPKARAIRNKVFVFRNNRRGQSICFGLLFSLGLMALACRLNLPPGPGLPIESSPASPTSSPQINLADLSPTTGLANLNSYRANLIVEFEGTRNGQPATGRLESLTEVTRQPVALHHYLKVNTNLTSTEIISGESEFYRVADKIYLKKGAQGDWFTFTDSKVTAADVGFLALDHLIVLPVTVSQPSQTELLEGRKVQRFSFTEHDLAAPNIIFEQAEGDLWQTKGGDFLAQYVISATLRLVILDPKVHLFDQGHLNLRYTLTDINADFTINPPQDAFTESTTLNRLPRLPDAQIVSIFPTFIEYTSAITPINAALFYRDQLTSQGWAENQAEIFNEKARLTYAKDEEMLTVLITPSDERDKIKILLDLK